MFLIEPADKYKFHLLLFRRSRAMILIGQFGILHQQYLHTLSVILHHLARFKIQQVLPEIGTGIGWTGAGL